MTASDALVPAVDAPADRIAGSGLGTPSAERSAICLATTTYRTVRSVDGPLLFVEAVRGVGLGELVSIGLPDGRTRDGQVLEVREGLVVVQTFSGTEGIDVRQTRVRFLGAPARAAVGRDMLGRSFDGLGRPIDGGPPCLPESLDDVNGLPMNPVARDQPNEFIQTGVSAIDGLDTLVRGQKLPIFSAFGLPGNDLAAQIAINARVEGGEPFAVVFGAVGITHRESAFFRSALQQAGAMQRTVLFVNLADDPTLERLLTPRFALTAAEHLAFRCGMHVLVILTDMTNYCEALRELAAAREEVPGRRGYPGYMYTDLASLYERAGRIRGTSGSITQVTILSMPDDDMTHPIPDLTGYITEGQIVLSRELHRRGVEPPIDPLPCLSRLMDQGIGAGKTREDHRQVADQLYAAYASGRSLRRMEAILGESALSPLDRRYLAFADAFETQFVGQGAKGRTVGETLDLGWKLLGHLPRAELKHVRPDQIERYWQQMDDGAPPGASVSESRAPDS